MELCGPGNKDLEYILLIEYFLPGGPVNYFEHLVNSLSEISQTSLY